VFFINLSIGLVAAVIVVSCLKDSKFGGVQAAGRVDWAGMALL